MAVVWVGRNVTVDSRQPSSVNFSQAVWIWSTVDRWYLFKKKGSVEAGFPSTVNCQPSTFFRRTTITWKHDNH
jgi:hypothetical protein